MAHKDEVYRIDFDNLIYLKKNFTVKKSTSTYQIQVDGNKKIYSDGKFNFKIIHIVNELKKELFNQLAFFVKDEKEVGYYLYGKDEIKKTDKIYNIDLKSAYLTCLFNTKKISYQLFTKINLLSKADRLKVLGMLAYEPFIFNYVEGVLESTEKIKNIYRPIFFYCVKRTFEIIKVCARKITNDFIFAWVDGIYFTGEKNIKIIQSILNTNRFKSSLERLFYFSAKKTDEICFFSYNKFESKKNKFINKNIAIPDNNLTRLNSFIFELNINMENLNNKKVLECVENYLISK